MGCDGSEGPLWWDDSAGPLGCDDFAALVGCDDSAVPVGCDDSSCPVGRDGFACPVGCDGSAGSPQMGFGDPHSFPEVLSFPVSLQGCRQLLQPLGPLGRTRFLPPLSE